MTSSRTPDPTFYPSPRDAVAAPPERLAYVAAFDRSARRPGALAVLGADPASPAYGTVIGWTDLPNTGDDLRLYVSCWGTGELKQYDVSDPFAPVEPASIRLGGVVRRTAHPAAPGERLAGGPQMVEVSRDGRRACVANSLYGSWDDQFYPCGVGAWMAKPDTEEFTLDERLFPHGDDCRGLRVHHIRLQGGDASSDSCCYP